MNDQTNENGMTTAKNDGSIEMILTEYPTATEAINAVGSDSARMAVVLGGRYYAMDKSDVRRLIEGGVGLSEISSGVQAYRQGLEGTP